MPEHRPFCATLADIEERERPDLQSAAGQAKIFQWMGELSAAATPEIHAELDRVIDALDFFFQVGEANFESEDFEQFDRLVTDLEQIEAYTDWSCFGEANFEIKVVQATTAAPAVTTPTQSANLTAAEEMYCAALRSLS
ncbi:MAG: hypothetical protein ACI91O_001384 [Candidatus Poriferisodalaceae bacterium]|jgi:hypothetical protein